MSIRSKALAAVSLALALVIGALCWLVGGAVESGFAKVEQRAGEAHMQRAREVMLGQAQVLCEKVGDWARWDDAYAFAVDHNPEFLAVNITANTFETLKIDMILMYDSAGKPLITEAHDVAGHKLVPPPQSLLMRHFGAGSPILRHPNASSSRLGLLATPGLPPALFCSVPVVTSEGNGPIRGAMVFGKYLRERERKHLSDSLKLDVALAFDDDKRATFDVASAMRRLPRPDAVAVAVASEEFLDGYTRFPDYQGSHSLVARARIPREIHQQAVLTQKYVAMSLLGVGILAMIAVVMMLELVVLRRVVGLTRAVTEITETTDYSRRVATRGRDEVASLGQSINGFLAAVEQVLDGALLADAKYGALVDLEEHAAAVLGVTTADGDGNTQEESATVIVYDATPAFSRELGWGEDMVGQPLSAASGLSADAAAGIARAALAALRTRERQRFTFGGAAARPLSVRLAPLGRDRALALLGIQPSEACASPTRGE